MPRLRFRVVLVLLVVILLVVSMLFGLLTYWIDAEILPQYSPESHGVDTSGESQRPPDANAVTGPGCRADVETVRAAVGRQ